MEHHPGVPAPTGEPGPGADGVLARLEALERHVAGWGDEVRTRRVVVVDAQGSERLVTEVGDTFTEVRLRIGEGRRRLDLLLVAAREPADVRAGTAGVEVWLDGDHVGGFTVTPER